MDMPDLHIDRASNIPAAGWAVVLAGAAFGGAVLHVNRVVGAVIVGGLAFLYELSQAPCCSDCAAAAGAGCGPGPTAGTTGTTPSSGPKNTGIVPPVYESTSSGLLVAQQPRSTAPLSADYVGSRPSGAFDPSSTFTQGGLPQADTDSSPNASSSCRGCQ